MKVTYSWLKEYVDFDLSAVQLADKLVSLGINVENIRLIGEGIEGIVVVGKIISIEPHPQADRLTVCKVNTGKKEYNIVCGASNMKVGDIVPLALEGAVLSENKKIKLVNIRGIKSEGMMCSAKELGISDDMSGLLILPRETSLGKEIKKVLSLPDIVFDLEITPNRADCLSLIGIAREIAATLNIPFKLPEINLKDTGNEIGKQARVTIKEPLLCPRYLARVIRNVKISPSPFWLQRRLEMVGLRAINNVVDATNYVLMELGHPLHAFDYDQINNHHIIVRRAEEKEKFKTLEGMEYTLDKDMLVIADEKKTVALAGIMGGSNSQVNNETCNLLIESAYFDAINIRRTSKKLGLTTESSYRFERGTDFEMAAKAINRVTSLIREIAGGQVVEGIIDQYPQKIVPHNIILRPKQVNRILGIEISKKQILDFLNRLGFECDLLEDNANLKVKVPAFRQEVSREIDLIEEIARIYKYDEIPPAVPRWKSLEYSPNREFLLEKEVKDFFVSAGFFEVMNYSFSSEGGFNKLGVRDSSYYTKAVKVKNPLSREYSFLRTTLLGNILENIFKNINYNLYDLKLFETGKIFFAGEKNLLPEEKKIVSGAICGMIEESYWQKKSRETDFFYLKGVIIRLLENLGIKDYKVEKGSNILFHPKQSAKIIVAGNIQIGQLGKISPWIAEKYNFDFPVYIFELDMGALLKSQNLKRNYFPISKYPAVVRDVALVVPEGISYFQVSSQIKKTGGKVITQIKLFDVYQGKQIDRGFRSMAYSIIYQSGEKTLTDKEVNSIHNKVLHSLEKNFKVKIRDK